MTYDVLTARKWVDKSGEEKTSFTNIGKAFDNKNGDGFSIILNALPLSDGSGEARLIVKKSKPRDVEGSYKTNETVNKTLPTDFGNDDVPF